MGKEFEGVAIIGMAGRFPKADSVGQFWENTVSGTDCTEELSIEEIIASGVEPSVASSADYVRRAALLEEIDKFDAEFFDYLPIEAELLDPQIRVFLESVQTALDDAGCDPDRYDGSIGVYAGAGLNNYLLKNVLRNPGHFEDVLDFQTVISSDKDFLTTQVNYKLNLKGPGVTVQTACSTSLVAIQLAYQALLTYQCDIAVSGGTHIRSPRAKGTPFREGDIYSPDGVCRPFDEGAAGTIFGEGAGVVVLKRVEDAIQDRDHIYAIIRGAAINNDGSNKVSYAAPSVAGQAEVVAMAHRLADISAGDIGYVEAHGTGTKLGDPIEVRALTDAFRLTTDKKNSCAISSVKSMVGHLDVAAGVTGLIRAALALHHKVIPPTLHYKKPNPELKLEKSPFYVCTEASDWESGSESPRFAAVSSFGVGGTNAHAVLQEAPLASSTPSDQRFHLLTLSAKTPAALAKKTEDLAEYFTESHDIDLADAAYTLQVGRREFAHRKVVVCESIDDALSKLQSSSQLSMASGVAKRTNKTVSFMFSGQGSQHVNMCRDLYHSEPIFAECLNTCAEAVSDIVGCNLLDRIFLDDPAKIDEENLRQTAIAQPAIYAVECGLAKVWESYGIAPKSMIGHSIGEFAAAHMAGVFSLEDGAKIVAMRGRQMQRMPAGAMLGLRNAVDDVEFVIKGRDLSIVVVNGPELTVVGGSLEEIGRFKDELEAEDISADLLHTSHAFHSPMMNDAVAPFVEEIAQFQLSAPQIPFISNVTGDWITAEQATDPDYWGRQLRSPVQFSNGIETLCAKGNSILLEVGPGQALSTLCQQQVDTVKSKAIISTARHPKQKIDDVAYFYRAFGAIWANGGSSNLARLYASESRKKMPLPTYPFERKSYWIESSLAPVIDEQRAPQEASSGRQPILETEQPETTSPSPAEVKSSDADFLLNNVLAIMERVLGLSVNEQDLQLTFFELGVDSLALTRLSAAFEKNFGIKLTPGELSGDVSSVSLVVDYLQKAAPRVGSFAPAASASSALAEQVSRLPSNPNNPSQQDLVGLLKAMSGKIEGLESALSKLIGKDGFAEPTADQGSENPRIEADIPGLAKTPPTTESRLARDKDGKPIWYAPDGGEYKKVTR